jgi:hypothetical protein
MDQLRFIPPNQAPALVVHLPFEAELPDNVVLFTDLPFQTQIAVERSIAPTLNPHDYGFNTNGEILVNADGCPIHLVNHHIYR